MGEAPRLKPMTSTEILDGAFRLYRNNFATFLGILAIAYVPIIAIMMAVTGVLLSNLDTLAVQADRNEVPPEVIVVFLIAVGGGVLYMLIAMPLATGALTAAVGARYLNEPISIGKAYGHVMPMFFKYLGTTMLSGLAIALGFPFCLAPGFLFMTWFFASSPICVLEGLGGTAAMGRSRELVRGHGGRVFGLLFLSIILQNAVSAPVNFGADLLSKLLIKSLVTQNLVSSAVQQGFNMLITPFFSVIVILLYYDLRIRKEAFDLEVLAQNLGKAAPKAAPAQP
jgi:hypothetical protein